MKSFQIPLIALITTLLTSLHAAETVAPSFPPVDAEPLGTVSANALVLHDNWQMREEAIVGDHGDTFSSPTFDAKEWYPAKVPTTALANCD